MMNITNENIYMYIDTDELLIDDCSMLGKDIKRIVTNLLQQLGNSTSLVGVKIQMKEIFEDNNLNIYYIDTNIIFDFYNKYCVGPKSIKDDVWYHINGARNAYKFLTLSRDLEKSPRKEITNNQVKKYDATYDTISKDPDMIASYYSSKYGISDASNIVTLFTEDDVMCLGCGCISDERLTDVPDKKIHIRRFKCPRCKSITSPIAIYNRYTHQLNTIYRDSNTNSN